MHWPLQQFKMLGCICVSFKKPKELVSNNIEWATMTPYFEVHIPLDEYFFRRCCQDIGMDIKLNTHHHFMFFAGQEKKKWTEIEPERFQDNTLLHQNHIGSPSPQHPHLRFGCVHPPSIWNTVSSCKHEVAMINLPTQQSTVDWRRRNNLCQDFKMDNKTIVFKTIS
jgi:hypothetical protein